MQKDGEASNQKSVKPCERLAVTRLTEAMGENCALTSFRVFPTQI
jgi:hypothetical protein